MSGVETSVTAGVMIDAKAAAIGVTSAAIGGPILGLHFECLLGALAGSMFTLALSRAKMTRGRLILFVFGGTIGAAYAGPIVSEIVTHSYPHMAEVELHIRAFAAMIAGFSMRILLPAIANRIERYGAPKS